MRRMLKSRRYTKRHADRQTKMAACATKKQKAVINRHVNVNMVRYKLVELPPAAVVAMVSVGTQTCTVVHKLPPFKRKHGPSKTNKAVID